MTPTDVIRLGLAMGFSALAGSYFTDWASRDERGAGWRAALWAVLAATNGALVATS